MMTYIWVNTGSGNEWLAAWQHQIITWTNVRLIIRCVCGTNVGGDIVILSLIGWVHTQNDTCIKNWALIQYKDVVLPV